MPKSLNISQILVYYDMPELFIATDEVKTNFICILIDLNDNVPNYIATAISSLRLSFFIKGQVELREILSRPESKEWYTFIIENEQIFATRAEFEIIPGEFLPDNG